MKRADIRKRIDELMVRGLEEYDDLRRRLVNEMTVCAMYDFNEIYDLKKMSLHDIESIDGRLIHECKQNRDGTYTVKLVDKLKAIEMLGRHLALFQDKVDVTSNGAQISVTVNSPEVKEALDAALND
jgi:phage terminase small subunit